MRQKRRSFREPDDDEDSLGEHLAAVNERLDELTRQLERMAQAGAGGGRPNPNGNDPHGSDRVADALARLDRRLEQVIDDSRSAGGADRRPRRAPPPAPPTPPARGPSAWAAQISARQRALDEEPGAAANAAPAPAPAPARATRPAAHDQSADFAGLEQQLREINTQISALQRPYEDALGALRNDLAEIGRMLTEAMPRQAIEALEADVRALAERLDRTRQAGADGTALATLEQGLSEVRDALRSLKPAESLVGLEEAVTGLSYKIDQIATSAQPAHDPIAFKQLEQAVVSLRGVVSNVASDGALGQLAAEVRGLAAQFERATADSSTEALARLEARIAALMESGRTVPPELEGSIRELSERLDRAQLSQGDQLALGALEDRIAKLSEKLDASDSRLNHLEAIERGLAELLVHLEEMRSNGPRPLRTAVPPEAPPEPPQAVRETPQAVCDTPQAARAPEPPPPPPASQPQFAMVQAPAPPPPPAPAPAPAAEHRQAPQSARPRPRHHERPPINPELPPDTPLEPGSGAPRIRPGSPAARIAASEAALGSARPAAAESGSKAAAIAAARTAAKSAYLDTPVKVPKTLRGRTGGGWFNWRSRAKAKPLPEVAPEPVIALAEEAVETPPSGNRAVKFLKTLLIAASVAIIVIGAVQMAMDLLLPSEPQAIEPPAHSLPSMPSRPMPTPQGSLPGMPSGAEPGMPSGAGEAGGRAGSGASFLDPTTIVIPNHPAAQPATPEQPRQMPRSDITGSIPRLPAPRPDRDTAGRHGSPAKTNALPGSISPALRAAAAANDPAAEYELGIRYAEGRGVPQNIALAIQWLERAANAGLAQAQFRLASLNEKGEGLKKDLQTARRLYLAAAGKGHAKSMHNLAVLHAEGIDGKPDYKVAAEWFRKAAAYGIGDSQYNLAILYARGIGVPANLAESYKWFALAAAKGDREAGQKRDEVAARLDQQTLTAARLAVQTFVPEREPEEATTVRTPPGGWDRVAAPAAKPRHRSPASTAR